MLYKRLAGEGESDMGNAIKEESLQGFRRALEEEKYEECEVFMQSAREHGVLEKELQDIILRHVRNLGSHVYRRQEVSV